MLLSDHAIRAEVAAGRVVVDPWDTELIQPSSVDIRLDRYFRKGDDPFVLHPGQFVLGSTLEIVTLPDDLAGR